MKCVKEPIFKSIDSLGSGVNWLLRNDSERLLD